MRADVVVVVVACLISSIPLGHAQVKGSGFFFSPDGYLLTNLHVVNGCKTASIRVNGGAIAAPVLLSDTKDDLAILKANHSPAFLSFRADQRLKLGENVVAVGYPLAGLVASSMNLTTGTISALAGIGEDTRMIQFTAPASSHFVGCHRDERRSIRGTICS